MARRRLDILNGGVYRAEKSKRYCCFCLPKPEQWRCTYLCVSILVVVVVDIGLVIGALVLLLQSRTLTRERLVQSYREAVGRWSARGLRRFSTLNVSVSLDSGEGAANWDGRNMSVLLMRDGEASVTDLGPENVELPGYESLVYRGSLKGMLGLDQANYSRFHLEVEGLSFSLESAKKTFTVSLSDYSTSTTQLITIGPFPWYRLEPAGGVDSKYPNRVVSCDGMQYERTCWVLSRLTSLSLQVGDPEMTPVRPWLPYPRVTSNNMSYGCDYEHGKWNIATYTVVDGADAIITELLGATPDDDYVIPHWTASTALTRLAAGGPIFEVRSSSDPWLYAIELTGGTLNFGVEAKSLQFVGYLLLGVGLLLCFPLLVVLRVHKCIAWVRKKYATSKGLVADLHFTDYTDLEDEQGRQGSVGTVQLAATISVRAGHYIDLDAGSVFKDEAEDEEDEDGKDVAPTNSSPLAAAMVEVSAEVADAHNHQGRDAEATMEEDHRQPVGRPIGRVVDA